MISTSSTCMLPNVTGKEKLVCIKFLASGIFKQKIRRKLLVQC